MTEQGKNRSFKGRNLAGSAAARKSYRKRQAAPLAAEDPATSDRHYDPEEVEFLAAVSEYQKRTGRKFPTFCEVFAIVKGLGYSRRTPE